MSTGSVRRSPRPRRIGLSIALALGALLGLAACAPAPVEPGAHYEIAGGGKAGVYYTYGDRLAAALHQRLGVDFSVAETQGSVENLRRIASGESLIGFAQGDTAVDAVSGAGSFDTRLPVTALARVYDEYVHVVVPADSDARRISDLAGRRVSLGSESSGVQVIATRVLEAAGVDPETVENPALSLDASIDAMQRGELDGFFWVGGLPTPGIVQLQAFSPIRLLPIDATIVDRVNAGHSGVYRLADFTVGAYGIEAPAVTMTVPNYLVASAHAPDDLIYAVVRSLFDARAKIARDVTAAELLDRRQAIFTGPIELHPGAARYYVDARR